MKAGRPVALARMTAVLAAAAGLLLAAPAPAASLHAMRAATTAGDPTAPLVALLSLLAWVLLGWLLLVVTLTAATRLPGRGGLVAGIAGGRVAPAAVRRRVALLLGTTLAVGALGAGPAFAGNALPPVPHAAGVALDWPTATPVPLLDWNAAAPTPASPHPASMPPAHARPGTDHPVLVAPGDSLWSVAAEHLPAGASATQIAAAWPGWWAANRDAVGSNPDLIHPGLQLDPPVQH